MRIQLSRASRAWVGAAVMGMLCGPVLAEAAGHHITAKVEMENSNDFKGIAGSNAKTKVQHRQIKVTLDNRDKERVTDVSVKWAIYARKMDSNKIVPAKQGTAKAVIESLSTATVQGDKVTITGTPKHIVTTRKTVRGKVQNSNRSVAASGEEYYGYSVAVYAGSELIDEVYSQPSLKPTK